jgi:hypothetical protein
VEPGLWRYRRDREELWLPRLALVVGIPEGGEGLPWRWRLGALSVVSKGTARPWVGTIESPGAREILQRARSLPLASSRPNPVRRWLDAAERLLGVSEVTGELLDLREALSWLLQEQGTPAIPMSRLGDVATWPDLLGARVLLEGGLEGKLEASAMVLRSCADATASLRSFRTFVQAGGGRGTPVDFGSFSFSREDVHGVPEVPGIYRFLGTAQDCIYVGKAKNLKQRLLSYFAPLTEGSRRRSLFLTEVKDLEWVPLPSELSALILESAQIREERPRWNVKVETHRGWADTMGDAEGYLIFAIPSALEPGWEEVYLLRAGRAGRLKELIDPSSPPDREALGGALEAFFSQGESPLCEILHPQDATLVHRWYRSYQDDLLKLRADHFSSWGAAAGGLLSALSESAASVSPREGEWVREAPRDLSQRG